MVTEGRRMAKAIDDAGIDARLFGGIAIALQCHIARSGRLQRTYADLDVIVKRRAAGALSDVMVDLGYRPAERFNTLHGRARLLFESDVTHVDVFVNQFEMCHFLDLGGRLDVVPFTLPLADLLLTKLQVAELNLKDVSDASAILIDHDLTPDDTGINLTRCVSLLASDWGWWRTATENIGKIENLATELGLDAPQIIRLKEQRAALSTAIEEAPKTMRWRARAKVGERVAWRNDPEEVAH